MRKHDVRKWLHAVLDLLPVILIPVFMIYSHRHDVTENVQINYKYQSNVVNTLDDLVVNNVYEVNFNNQTLDYYCSNSSNSFDFIIYQVKNYDFNRYNSQTLDDMLLEYYGNDFSDCLVNINITDNKCYFYFYLAEDYDYIYSILVGDLTDSSFTFNFIGKLNNVVNYDLHTTDLFKYTDYNVIESVDIENTNVMDSFMNNFNNTIDKHFNMGNVFNLGNVYQWFNVNIFGGNAPVVIYSIYNIVLYELVMDLLFLLYALFMWFIDMIQKLMEKPLNSIK